MQSTREFRHSDFALQVGGNSKSNRVDCTSAEQMRGARSVHRTHCGARMCSNVRQRSGDTTTKYRGLGVFRLKLAHPRGFEPLASAFGSHELYAFSFVFIVICCAKPHKLATFSPLAGFASSSNTVHHRSRCCALRQGGLSPL